MAELSIILFGSPGIELLGKPVAVDTRKATALLAYLAVTGQRHTRDSLATLFWPDYDQVHARSALRRTLSALQKALKGNYLNITRESLSLEMSDRVLADVTEFRAQVHASHSHLHARIENCPECTARLERAAELYQGDFLAGFTLRDSSGFDEWQFFEAETLKREFAGVLETLVSTAVAGARLPAALGYAQRWLALDVLREDVHRTLMSIYAWSGQRNAALRQYRECLRILNQELGVPPLEETTRLYQAILSNDIPPPPSLPQPREQTVDPGMPGAFSPSGTDLPPGMAFPLVGRSRESEIIEQTYQHAARNGHLITLEGEPGIGKTRLAEAFLSSAQSRGAVVLDARAFPGESNLAYGLLISGLTRLLALPESSRKLQHVPQSQLMEGARLLPEIHHLFPNLPTSPAMSGPGGQTRFFEGLRQIILSLLHGPLPGILFLEDLQWADATSLEFLRYFVRRLDGQALFILATWLEHALPETLHQIIGEAQRRDSITRVRLQRLTQEDLTDLVRVAIHKYPDAPPDLAERLYHETEGLPFFAVEYLEAIVTNLDSQALEPVELSSASGRPWEIPDAVRDALLTRTAAAGDAGWQLLSTAAVIGRSFDFDTLLAASGRNEAEAISGLERLISLGLIDEQSGSRAGSISYDFTHDQIRRLAYEETTLTRRRLIHRRVADALAGQMRRRPDPRILANQVAFHYQQAGLDAQAAEYFLLAANYARDVFANQEAIINYQAALVAGHPDTALIHELIGDLTTLQGEYRSALAEYETTAALTGASARLEQKIGNLHHRRGEWELAACHYQLALETDEARNHPEIAAQILADWSLTAHHQGQEEEAREYATQSLRLATEAGVMPALAAAHNILGILARRSGQSQAATQHLRDSLLMAQQMNDANAQIAALNNLALASQDAGDLAEAIDCAQEALALCRTRGDRHREAALLNHLADLYHLMDDSTSAMSYLKDAVLIFSEIGITEGGLLPEIWKLTEW